MNLKSSLVLFLLGIGLNVTAQTSIGIVGFSQISNLTSKEIRTDPVRDNRLSLGGGGGIMFTKGISEKTGFQVGILYSAQKQTIISNYTINGEENSQKSGKHFDYLKIPILLRYVETISRKKSVDFIAFAGPQFSYLLKYNGGMIVYVEDQYFDLPSTPAGNNFFNKYTIDAVIGAGLEFPVTGNIGFTSALKADLNLTNAQNPNAHYNGIKVSDLNGGEKAKNLTIGLLVGINYTFPDPNALISPSNKFRKSSYKGNKKRY